MVNWYKQSDWFARKTDNYYEQNIDAPNNYFQYAHPNSDTPKKQWKDDVFLWSFGPGGLNIYPIKKQRDMHGGNTIPSGSISGRFSKKRNMASIIASSYVDTGDVVDAILSLEEHFGGISVFINQTIDGKVYNGEYPVNVLVKSLTDNTKLSQNNVWYKIAQEKPEDGLYPPSYFDVAHPEKDREKEWGDIRLWFCPLGGQIKTYKLSRRYPTHDYIPGFGNNSKMFYGRYSENQGMISMTFWEQNEFSVVDIAMQLLETFGDHKIFVSGDTRSKKYNQIFPSISALVKELSSSLRMAQTIEQLQQQYSELADSNSVNITGTGQSETLQLPGGQMINAGDLLRQALNMIQHVLVQNGVREVNTDPLYENPQAQGLAVSHEPGKIRVDVKRILDGIRGSLPPVSQLDGVEMDPDVSNNVVQELSNYILAELGETMAHESQHTSDYGVAIQQGNPFTSVQEAPAEQFGQRMRQQYFGV